MSDKTGIEWTDATWNPVTGCTKVSPGCDHCYAETFAERFRGVPGHHFEQGFDVVLRPERLGIPLRWKRPRRIFVNSVSDLFHDDVPWEFIARVWAVMAQAQNHTFQILTKRHARMRSVLTSSSFWSAVNTEWCNLSDWYDGPIADVVGPHSSYGRWPLPNVWLGVSVEDQKWASVRIPALLDTPAAVRFLSCEPMLGPVDLRPAWTTPQEPVVGFAPALNGTGAPWPHAVDWVIVGGESGRGARPMHPNWARSLRDQCVQAGVAFHFKQWGEWAPLKQLPALDQWSPTPGATRETTVEGKTVYRARKRRAGRELDGRTWDEFPR